MIVAAPATSKWRTSSSSRVSAISAGRDRGGGDPDRDVDPQHPLPAEVFGQHAAEQDAGGAAGAGDRAPDPQRFVALGAVAEGGGDDRERGGGEDRGAEPLDGAGGDQLPGVGRQAAGQRGEREEHQAEHEDAAAAEQVGEPAAEQQEAAEGEHVGVDHPGQAALGEVERFADRRQGDVDDRGVEDDHELRRAEQDQGDPALVAGFGGVGHRPSSMRAEDFTSPRRLFSKRAVSPRPCDRPPKIERMCRNISTLHNFDPPATEEEIQASALQYVRKISGSTKPSQANAEAFEEAVEAVAEATRELLDRLVTTAPPKDREVEAAKARARSAKRFAA